MDKHEMKYELKLKTHLQKLQNQYKLIKQIKL